jgi:hypothetical protein
VENIHTESLNHLTQETGVSKSSAKKALKLTLRPYKTTAINTLQVQDPTSRVHLCNWFLQSIIEDENDLRSTFFSDEAWFHSQGYIHMQNNHYLNSQNTHLTYDVLLY